MIEQIEFIAVTLSIIYVILASRENHNCWYFGILSVSVYIYICLDALLYAETLLQIVYLFLSFYGLYNWKKKSIINEPLENTKVLKLKISEWPVKKHFTYILIFTILSFSIGILLNSFSKSELPFIDAFTTSFSLLATYMTVKKVLENWLYWIIIDLTSVFLYHERDLHLTAFLFIIYTVIATFAYFNWKSKSFND